MQLSSNQKIAALIAILIILYCTESLRKSGAFSENEKLVLLAAYLSTFAAIAVFGDTCRVLVGVVRNQAGFFDESVELPQEAPPPPPPPQPR